MSAFGQLGPLLRHAARKGVASQQSVRQVVRLGAGAEHLAVAGDAADRDAAEVHAVIALLAADQAGFARLAFGAPVGARHLQRGVRRFRAGAGEEHVVEARRRQCLDLVGQFERQRVAELEGRRVIQRRQLALGGVGDFLPAVPQSATP